jgi:hypothetical protein
MSDESKVRWHEIINDDAKRELPFLGLYREYAEALRHREEAKRAKAYWPEAK